MSVDKSAILQTDAWTRARDRFVEDLSDDEKAAFNSTYSLEEVFYSASAAQKLHQDKSKSLAYISKIQPLIKAIQQYETALDVYSNASSLIMCPLWGSMKVLIKIASDFGKYLEKIVDMLKMIGDALPRFRAYEKLFSTHERLIQELSMAYLIVLRFCIEAKAIFRNAKRSKFFTTRIAISLLWKPFDQQFGGLIDEFHARRKAIEKEAGLSHMIEAGDARSIQQWNTLQLEKERKERDRVRLLSHISSIKYQEEHRRMLRMPHLQSGKWLFESKPFTDWVESPESGVLCCFGIPGSGKTILTSNVINFLSSKVDNKSSAIAFHYCTFSEPITLQTVSILGTILKQLLLPKSSLLDTLYSELSFAFQINSQIPDAKDLAFALRSVLTSYSEVYIIIDGLDECEKDVQQDILYAIEKIIELDEYTIKVWISSREDTDIMNELKKYPSIHIAETKVAGDIANYVEVAVKAKLQSGELFIRDQNLEEEIISTLTTKSQGMFLWVSLQLQEMCDTPQSDEGIRKSLKELPIGLVKTYSRIIEKMEKNRPKFLPTAEKALQWVICARRPLSMNELKEGIAFGPADQYWQADKIITDPSGLSILKACGHLITLDDEDDTVRLIHRTVRQFLMDKTNNPEHRPRFHREKAEFYLGEVCVTYLSFSDFETQMTGRSSEGTFAHKDRLTNGVSQLSQSTGIGAKAVDLSCRLRGINTHRKPSDIDCTDLLRAMQRLSSKPEVGSKYQLLGYAVENWVWHTMPFTKESTESQSLWLKFERLATNNSLDFQRWGAMPRRHLPYLPLLPWAVREGHYSLTEILLLNGGTQFRIKGTNETALHIAAQHGYEAVVKLLLDRGAKTEARDGGGTTALHLAAKNGHEAVVLLLLNMGAAVEARCHTNMTVLHQAACNGHEAIASHLIDWGADIEATDKSGQTALFYAACYGYAAVVNLLLNNGANVEVREKFRDSTALHEAAFRGHTRVVELLLRSGADKDAKDIHGKTAAEGAAEQGHKEVEMLLLSEVYLSTRDESLPTLPPVALGSIKTKFSET